MALGVPGLEFEAHGRIAPADFTVEGNGGESYQKPAKNRIPGHKTALQTDISPARGLKSDRLLGRQLLMPPPLAGVTQDAGEVFPCFWGKLEVGFFMEDIRINRLAGVHRSNSRLRHTLHEFGRIGRAFAPIKLRVALGDRCLLCRRAAFLGLHPPDCIMDHFRGVAIEAARDLALDVALRKYEVSPAYSEPS